MENMQTQEMISALADGQLRGEAFARGVAAVANDAEAREAWQTYHMIGDVLRGGQYSGRTVPSAFLSRLQPRLQQEHPAVQEELAPVGLPGAHRGVDAANDGSFRWKMVAGFASLAAVAALGWTVVGGLGAKPEQAQLAAGPGATLARTASQATTSQPASVQTATPPPTTVLAEGERGVMIRDARLDELLAAHRQLGGASALQMPAGFLRNATFEGPIR